MQIPMTPVTVFTSQRRARLHDTHPVLLCLYDYAHAAYNSMCPCMYLAHHSLMWGIAGTLAAVSAIQVLQLGMLGFVLYFCEACLENGFLQSVGDVISKLITGTEIHLMLTS